MSNCAMIASERFSSPSLLQDSFTFFSSHAVFSSFFTFTSMLAKRLASSGSSRLTSSEWMNRGSR